MRLNNLAVTIFLLGLSLSSPAQMDNSLDINNDNDYYLFPINPGVQNTLAGTMGELRSSHFHSGIDIRTGGRTGLAVHAAAGGYISRAAVSPTGYGNALYIQHPNGETTVYAHLEKFEGPVADYVRKEQYRRKRFKVNLYFRKDQFKINRGDTIAWSGNSGSSGGPHLHFDIRDKNQRPLNPLKYGFEEVVDRTPPVASILAVKTMDIDSRVAGEFGRKKYALKRVGNNYVINEPIYAVGNLGFELLAHDKLDYARFRCGINTINFTIDEALVFSHQINSFAFSEQRNILKHMNYEELATSGKRYHKLYIDDGNNLKFYKTNSNRGMVTLYDEGEHLGKIDMIDTYGNNSQITFTLITSDQRPEKESQSGNNIHVQNNTLSVQTIKNDSLDLNVYIPEHIQLSKSYEHKYSEYYLWDLRNGLPKAVEKGDFYKTLDFSDMVPSGIDYSYFSNEIDIAFYKGSLFDTLFLETSYHRDSLENLELFVVGSATVPLKRNITVTLKPKRVYSGSNQAAVFRVNSKNKLGGYVGGEWKSGKIQFNTRNLGRFTIAYDSVPPQIKPLVITSEELKFRIEDTFSGLDKYECYLNGEWVLMNYDYKRKLIWSEKLDAEVPFEGIVKLIVTDNVNNKTKYETKIKL